MMPAVPFHAFDRRYAGLVDDVVDCVAEVAASDEFILQSRVRLLEAEIARRTGAGNAVACANGTGALTLVLTAMGIGPGDEVVTPAFSFISSASTIVLAGAIPKFADVALDSATLDLTAAEMAITSRTKALLPAHLFSHVAPMAKLRALANRHGIRVVEDSAVALGSVIDGKPAGRWGDVGVFSFFPAKPLGACGDAGIIVTDDDGVAARCRALRNHGQFERFRHDLVGFNCRMDEITAAFLLRRLATLDQQLAVRRSLAERYRALLGELAPSVVAPAAPPGRTVYTYVVRVDERDALREYLAARGIETAVYYPWPLHLQPAFAYLGHGPGDFPNAERLAQQCLALPLYAEMRPEEVDRVAGAVAAFYRSGS